MTGLRQAWLVARRELRERSRSKAFLAGLVVMLVVVVAAVLVPTMLERGAVTRDVGIVADVPAELPDALSAQARAVDVRVRVHRFDTLADGERAVREGDVDVLVVGRDRLEWRGTADERLRAVVTGSIQLVAVQARAVAAGIDPAALLAVVAPVPVENVELGVVRGRSPDDEAAAYVMTLLLLIALATYGGLVLSGVVEEKSSRVVEVLLARMPARTLLAGKVIGIGLLGFGQLVLTAIAALIATMVADSVDVPAVSGDVLAWVVVWFVLGYALYAMSYGAIGSLASRSEEASGVTGPITALLLAAYWASLVAVSGDPEGGWSRAVGLLPVTAPFAMPGRIALGVAAWWEPALAVALSMVAIAALVWFGGRVYAGAILHTGATLKLRDAWRGVSTTEVVAPRWRLVRSRRHRHA